MSNRNGFTLIEVLVAMVLLGFAILGVQASITDRFVRDVGGEDQRATAQQLAADRITAIQTDPQYTALSARYSGTENPPAGFPRYRRITAFTARTGYQIVTVSVITPAGADTVSRTIAVGAP